VSQTYQLLSQLRLVINLCAYWAWTLSSIYLHVESWERIISPFCTKQWIWVCCSCSYWSCIHWFCPAMDCFWCHSSNNHYLHCVLFLCLLCGEFVINLNVLLSSHLTIGQFRGLASKFRRQGLSRWSLRKLQQRKYQKGKEAFETCAICLDEFNDGDTIRVLPCSHSKLLTSVPFSL